MQKKRVGYVCGQLGKLSKALIPSPLIKFLQVNLDKMVRYVVVAISGIVRLTVLVPSHHIPEARP